MGKKDFNLIIEEATRSTLLEYMGVSDTVSDSASEILNAIIQSFPNYPILTAQIPILVKGDNNNYTIVKYDKYIKGNAGGYSFVARLFLYDAKCGIPFDTIYTKMVDEGFINVAFGSTNNIVKFFVPWPSDNNLGREVYAKYLSMLNHEVKHAYQHSKRGGMTPVTPQYKNALKYMHRASNEDETLWLMERYIPKVYYAFDPDEVDARVQELYSEASSLNTDITKTNAAKYIYELMNAYDSILKAYNEVYDLDKEKHTRQFIEAFVREKIGCDMKQFFSYCERGKKRFQKSLMRIYARWQQENQGSDITGNQGSFSRMARNEIPQQSPFKNKSLVQFLKSIFNFFI